MDKKVYAIKFEYPDKLTTEQKKEGIQEHKKPGTVCRIFVKKGIFYFEKAKAIVRPCNGEIRNHKAARKYALAKALSKTELNKEEREEVWNTFRGVKTEDGKS